MVISFGYDAASTGTRILHRLMASIFEHFHWQLPSSPDFTILHNDAKLIFKMKNYGDAARPPRDGGRGRLRRGAVSPRRAVLPS